MHRGTASPGDKDEPCGLKNDSVVEYSSAPAEFSQSWKLGWPFLQEQGLFFKVVLNPFFTVLVSYRRRGIVFKLFVQVVSCPGGFFFRWKSTWEGWGTFCSSTQGRCDEASVPGALGGTVKPSNPAPVPPQQHCSVLLLSICSICCPGGWAAKAATAAVTTVIKIRAQAGILLFQPILWIPFPPILQGLAQEKWQEELNNSLLWSNEHGLARRGANKVLSL